jgi:hypothetical protein
LRAAHLLSWYSISWSNLFLDNFELYLWSGYWLLKHSLHLFPLGIDWEFGSLLTAFFSWGSLSLLRLSNSRLSSSCRWSACFRSKSCFCWFCIFLFILFVCLTSLVCGRGIVLSWWSLNALQVLVCRSTGCHDQFLPEDVYFLLEFDDQGLHLLRGELNTDHSLVLDLLNSLGELQRLDCLFYVTVSPTGCTDKSSLW